MPIGVPYSEPCLWNHWPMPCAFFGRIRSGDDVMVISKFQYRRPGSLEEALSLLDETEGSYAILAGGTDLIVQMEAGAASPGLVVDVKKIPDLNRLEWSERGGLFMGAAVPLGRLIAYGPLRQHFPLLADACGHIGSTQIRNRASLGGNICNGAPSADSAPALLCLDAWAVIASVKGTRKIPMTEFFLGPGKTAVGPGELLVGLELPKPPPFSDGVYLRHGTRKEMDIAVANVACFLVLEPQGKRVKDARIALGAVAPTPVRAGQAESVLRGKVINRDLVQEAAQLARAAADPISDIRASADYRRALVEVLTRRALTRVSETLGTCL